MNSVGTIIPQSGRSTQVPALDVTTAPNAGDTAFLGGVVARWTEEAAQLNETEPALKQIELINYELSGYTKVSNTMLADSAIGLEAFLYALFGRAIAWYEDYGFLRGNGVGKPLGIFNWAGVVARFIAKLLDAGWVSSSRIVSVAVPEPPPGRRRPR
jgi:HK97 family phage major capsid protein